MKKFQFRLEKVLRYKEQVYEMARESYERAVAKQRHEQAIFDRIKLEYQGCMMQLIERTRERFNVKELAVYYKYNFYKKYELQEQMRVLEQVAGSVEQERQKLVAAAKDKEVLLRLRDKKYEKYQYLLGIEEQKFLDEMALRKRPELAVPNT